MLEGALKNLVNLKTYQPEPPGAPKKRKIQESFPIDGWYRAEDGQFYSIVKEDEKPPDPIKKDFDWVWWELDKKWIKMYNDVFEEKKGLFPKKLFHSNHCECM